MQKTITIDGIERPVILARRKGTRSIRITIKSNGTIRLSVPFGVPELVAKKFTQSKVAWINERLTPHYTLAAGDRIGKAHQLNFITAPVQKPRARVRQNRIEVTHPADLPAHDESVQKSAKRAAEKVLASEAAALLPQRLATLAKQHGFSYRSVAVKKLSSRWGSCSSTNEIILNTHLMQLPWELIDYVILHELTHTIHHHHQPAFWDALKRVLPDATEKKKAIKSYKTAF